mmetsp:Transcript_61229/g.84090  ORF Transcript_61229/g.84090 Transcript_61229/m.84090 type:complete len:168 (-) Transcript_61229:99-602(-)
MDQLHAIELLRLRTGSLKLPYLDTFVASSVTTASVADHPLDALFMSRKLHLNAEPLHIIIVWLDRCLAPEDDGNARRSAKGTRVKIGHGSAQHFHRRRKHRLGWSLRKILPSRVHSDIIHPTNSREQQRRNENTGSLWQIFKKKTSQKLAYISDGTGAYSILFSGTP